MLGTSRPTRGAPSSETQLLARSRAIHQALHQNCTRVQYNVQFLAALSSRRSGSSHFSRLPLRDGEPPGASRLPLDADSALGAQVIEENLDRTPTKCRAHPLEPGHRAAFRIGTLDVLEEQVPC